MMKAKKRTKRNVRPRKTVDYTNEEFGRADSSVPPDDKTLNPKCCRATLVRPRFNDGHIVFRAWPSLDPERPTERLQRGRITPNDRGQGLWIVRMPVASYIGLNRPDCEKITFILFRPGDRVAARANPYRHFYRACYDAYDSGEFGNGRVWDAKWNRLMKGSKNSGPEISAPTCKWFMQGEIYRNADKDYLESRDLPLGAAESDELVVIQISGSNRGVSTGEKLMDMLDKRRASYDGNEMEDPSLPFVYGDPCGVYNEETGGLEGGLFFTIFNPKKEGKRFAKVKHTSWSGKIADVQGYEVAISRTYSHNGEVYTPDLDESRTQQIFDKAQFWLPDAGVEDPDPADGLLYIPSVEEQCLWIAKAFKAVPKLVRFAWSHRPEFFTEEVKAVLAQRVQAVVPEGVEELDALDVAAGEFDDDLDDFPGDEIKLKHKSKRKKDVIVPDDEEEEDVDEFADDEEAEAAEFDADEAVDEFVAEDEEALDSGFVAAGDDDDDDEFNVDVGAFDGDADEFDPDEEANEIEAKMSESMLKANNGALNRASERTSVKKSPPKKAAPKKASAKKAAPKKASAKKASPKKASAKKAASKK